MSHIESILDFYCTLMPFHHQIWIVLLESVPKMFKEHLHNLSEQNTEFDQLLN